MQLGNLAGITALSMGLTGGEKKTSEPDKIKS
jgi:hypothetical protein